MKLRRKRYPQRHRQTRNPRRKKLRLESLEDRRLMAVDVNLLNGVLTIQGDSQNDWVSIESVYESYGFIDADGGTPRALADHFLHIKHGHIQDRSGTPFNVQLTKKGTKMVDKIVFYGGAGSDRFFNNTNIVSYQYGQSGSDHLHGGSDVDHLDGGLHNDYLYGKKGDDLLTGGSGNDRLQGGDGDDRITGNWGNDILQGGDGIDEVWEFALSNMALSDNSLTSQFGFLSTTDTLTSIEKANITGSWLNNILDASQFTAGAVTLNGSHGNDILLGSSSLDTLTGGAGTDMIHGGSGGARLLEHVAGKVTLSDKAMTVVQGSASTSDTLSSIDFATLKGSAGADVIDASGFTAGGVTIWAGAGNDLLIGGSKSDTLHGQTGNDFINGGPGNDTLDGMNGNDTLIGGQGDDAFYGGQGIDQIIENMPGLVIIDDQSLTINSPSSGINTEFVETISSIEKIHLAGDQGSDIFNATNFTGNVRLLGHGGNDALQGGSGNDLLFAGSGNDLLHGGKGDDLLHGGTGLDTLVESVSPFAILSNHQLKQFGFPGNLVESDTLHSVENAELSGSSSNDSIFANTFSGKATLMGMGGNDFLRGGLGENILKGGDGDDHLFGGTGNDILEGNDGHDFLFGSLGDDALRGNAGNDTLVGHHGDDTLYGGTGADKLSGGSGDDGLFGGGGNDSLTGGSDQDRFLTQDGDTITDKDKEDAEIPFVDLATAVTEDNGVKFIWSGGQWTDAEIELVDEALAVLHHTTGDNTFLKRKNGTEFTYQRIGSGEPNVGGWNSGDAQAFADSTFAGDDTRVFEVVFHEIGHNWEDENDDTPGTSWKDWKNLSSWTQADMSGNVNFIAATNGWFYINTANFVRPYATTDPKEDFACSFTAYFVDQLGLVYSGPGAGAAPAKMAFIGQFIASKV